MQYRITKTGENSYQLELWKNVKQTILRQTNALNIVKEDADGTKTVDKIEIKPSCVATAVLSEPENVIAGDKINGFAYKLSTVNVATGGTVFEIDSVTDLHADSSGSSGSSSSYPSSGGIG